MRRGIAGVILVLVCQATVSAQPTTVRQIAESPEQLDEWVKSGARVTVSGCYEGRFSRQFRLLKLPVTLKPGRNVVLPSDVESGQRIVVTGRFRKSGSRYEMSVERIAVGASDADRIRAAIRRLPPDQPAAGFDLAKSFQDVADFYEDDELAAELLQLRRRSFAEARELWQDRSADLTRLAKIAEDLKLEARATQGVRFEAVQALRRDAAATTKQRLDAVKTLEGWDTRNPFLDVDRERRFEQDPVAAYRSGTAETRRRMHRKVYRQIQLPQLLRTLKADGSNGDVVADQIAAQLPEEEDQIRRTRARYVDYRITRIPVLGQSGLTRLVDLLKQVKREPEISEAVSAWLAAQEKRLDVEKLDEQISLAEAYLFAADRFEFAGHEARGVELLKAAWLKVREVAPEEAATLDEKLRRYGWRWLGGRWMTKEQVERLPPNDPALALLERRVVKGMKADQVRTLMGGPPSRVISVASAQAVHEIWVFGERGNESLVVHVTRPRIDQSDPGVVTYVGRP